MAPMPDATQTRQRRSVRFHAGLHICGTRRRVEIVLNANDAHSLKSKAINEGCQFLRSAEASGGHHK
jgi:hypothetical protein